MTPPTDSLAAELAAVPPTFIASCISGCHAMDGGPDGPGLAAAARKWIGERMPNRLLAERATETTKASAYNRALADVAKALGLEP